MVERKYIISIYSVGVRHSSISQFVTDISIRYRFLDSNELY